MLLQSNVKHRLTTWNGRPRSPERSGWHWVDDSDGLRPLLWRGDDWPAPEDRGEWVDRYAMLTPRDLSGWFYYGPIETPPELAEIFAIRLRGEMT